MTHAGYRCPDAQCAGYQRTHRSAQADALAWPGFTYGLDSVLLVGRLRLKEHQTVDEVHQEVLKRLEPLGVKIARREILYLFEAYATLLRASSEVKDDQEWLAQEKRERGHHRLGGRHPGRRRVTRRCTRVARCARRQRVLEALNVTAEDAAVMKALLAPVVALGVERKVKVLGTITDAPSERTEGSGGVVARGAPPGVPVPG